MREGSSGSGETRSSTRQALVVAEVALSLVLLTGGGLLLKSFSSLLCTDPGIEPQGLSSVTVGLPSSRYPEIAQVTAFYERLLERTGELLLERRPRLCRAHAAHVDAPDRDSVRDQVVARGVIRVHADRSGDQQEHENGKEDERLLSQGLPSVGTGFPHG